MLDRAIARLSREEGVALVLAVIVVAALTISTAATIQLVTSNQTAFTRDRLETRAFNTAEEALNTGVSYLRTYDASGSVAINSSVGSSAAPVACCSSLVGWWAAKTAANVWTVYSIGRAPNGEVLRTLALQTQSNTTTVTTVPSLAWANGFFVADATGCTNMVGTATLSTPTWIKGSLCLNGTQQIAEPYSTGPQVVDLYVGGKLTITGSAQVGTSARPIRSANIIGGCYTNKAQVCSNSTKSNVHSSSYLATQSTLTKPPIYPDAEYAAAEWQSVSCAVGSFTFDNDSDRNTSVGTFDLFPASSYDCSAYKDGNLVGRLAWNASTNHLTIEGKVFIDGNMALNGGDQADYEGFGAIFVNGTVSTNGNSSLCGPPATVNGSSCNGLWDGDVGALGIVAINADNAATAWDMSGNAEYNVLAYVVGLFKETGTSKVTGPVVTDSAVVAGTPDQTDVPDPPDELPGGGSTVTSTAWAAVPGSWRQLPNGSLGG